MPARAAMSASANAPIADATEGSGSESRHMYSTWRPRSIFSKFMIGRVSSRSKGSGDRLLPRSPEVSMDRMGSRLAVIFW